MKKWLLIGSISCLSISGMFMTGCSNDSEDLAYPACDTSNVRLSVELNAIMSASCYSCHGGTAQLGGGIQLQTYSVIRAYALNGRLMGALKHEAGFSQMPKGQSKLSDCEISKFQIWVDAGAPNN